MSIRHRLRIIGIAGIIAVLLTGLTMVGFAGDRDESDLGEPIVQGPEEAREHDARMYADAFDVDLETAKRNLELQEEAGELRMALEEAEPETYAGQYANHGPAYTIIVLLTDGDPERVRPHVSGSQLEAFIEVRQVELSWHELREQHQVLIDIMTDLDVDYVSETNIRKNRVDVFVTDRRELEEAVSRAGHELPEAVEIAEEGLEVVTDDTAEPKTESGGHRQILGQRALASHGGYTIGGRTLEPKCTVGFPVRSSHGTAGFLSAGHCRYGQATYWTVNGVDTPLINEWWTGPYDVQWHATPHHAVYNQVMVRWSPYEVREITGVKPYFAQNIDDWVCVFGKSMSSQRCGQIVNLEHNSGFPNDCACFVRVSDPGGGNLADDGDSGGPWYKDTIAWGVHKSSIGPTSGPKNDAVYMPVDRIDNFGLSVLTWCPNEGCW